MSHADALDIKLQGREYRVACAAGEREDLLAVVAFLDWKMGELAKQTQSSGERLLVMTALNLAHELISQKEELSAAVSIDEQELKGKIDAMESQLDTVLEPRDTLS